MWCQIHVSNVNAIIIAIKPIFVGNSRILLSINTFYFTIFPFSYSILTDFHELNTFYLLKTTQQFKYKHHCYKHLTVNYYIKSCTSINQNY